MFAVVPRVRSLPEPCVLGSTTWRARAPRALWASPPDPASSPSRVDPLGYEIAAQMSVYVPSTEIARVANVVSSMT